MTNSPLKQAGGDKPEFWQTCESIYEIALQPINLQLHKFWQKHKGKRHSCIANRTELFSRTLGIKICCRSHYFLNFVKKAIMSYKRHTTEIHIHKAEARHILRFKNFWKYCAMIIHNLLINQIINFVLRCQSAV